MSRQWLIAFGTSTFFLSGCHYLYSQDQLSRVIDSGTISYSKLDEASGIAVSHRDGQRLWMNNDSGNPPIIYAVNPQGGVLASVYIKGVRNRDWEDMASFDYQGQPYLLIADVGDNDANRKHYSLHIIAEPEIDENTSPDKPIKVSPKWNIEFTYPDGAHDCEAVAVDMLNQQILLLSKREKRPKLFSIPLFSKGKVVAKALGDIQPLPPAKEKHLSLLELFNFATMPTGMDITPDGSSLAVMTYGSAYHYPNPEHRPWAEVFQQTPEEIALPALKQGEAIGFDLTGPYLYVTSEKLPAPLIKLSR